MWCSPSSRLDAMRLHDDTGTPEDNCGIVVVLHGCNSIQASGRSKWDLKCQQAYCPLFENLGTPICTIPTPSLPLLPLGSLNPRLTFAKTIYEYVSKFRLGDQPTLVNLTISIIFSLKPASTPSSDCLLSKSLLLMSRG